MNNSPALHLDQYSVSFWINPERNDEYWTGVFGRSGRNYAIWLGDSNHPNRPFIHHRFGEGDNVNEGINNFNLNSWGEWHHVVCSNGGIGGVARTYVNGSFFSNNQRFERKILDNLIKDLTAPLNIGVDPQNINSNSQYFLGKLDEIRFYNIPLGSEDVYHLFKGDPALVTYSAPSTDAFDGSSGSLSIITTPALPVITPPLLSYGSEVLNLDLGQNNGLNYVVSGIPDGLSNRVPFVPTDIPGIHAWYRTDHNNSFTYFNDLSFERNDTVAVSDQLLAYSFDENNESIIFDESGGGLHGNVIGDTFRSSGKFGGSISFDGDNDAVVLPKVEFMDSPQSFSISMWFKRLEDNQSTPTNNNISNVLFAQSSAATNDNLEIGTAGSEVHVYLDNGPDQSLVTSLAGVTNGIWHHLVFVYGNGAKLYVDGNLSMTSSASGPLDSSLDSPISLGLARPYSDQTGDFNGSIDDLRIFSRELNSSEVLSLYNNGNGDFSSDLYTNVDRSRISSWNDFSGSQRNAVANSYGSSPRSIPEPQTGKSLVSLPYGTSLQVSSAVSMPMNIMMVGRENGISSANREIFSFEGWRELHNGNWALRRWNDNNPSIVSSSPSNILSLVGWTFDRYGYELRVNGNSIGTSSSGNWHPNILFDKINGNSSLLIGDLILIPRNIEALEREKLEGYLAHKWNLQNLLPSTHPFFKRGSCRRTVPNPEWGSKCGGKFQYQCTQFQSMGYIRSKLHSKYTGYSS